jgi:uncharacterized membrane protein
VRVLRVVTMPACRHVAYTKHDRVWSMIIAGEPSKHSKVMQPIALLSPWCELMNAADCL